MTNEQIQTITEYFTTSNTPIAEIVELLTIRRNDLKVLVKDFIEAKQIEVARSKQEAIAKETQYTKAVTDFNKKWFL